MLKAIGSVFFIVHLMACLWYLLAKIEDFSPDTWVVRADILDDDNFSKYLMAVYWAF